MRELKFYGWSTLVFTMVFCLVRVGSLERRVKTQERETLEGLKRELQYAESLEFFSKQLAGLTEFVVIQSRPSSGLTNGGWSQGYYTTNLNWPWSATNAVLTNSIISTNNFLWPKAGPDGRIWRSEHEDFLWRCRVLGDTPL